MISAGEASGELYGALLSREIKKKWPDTEITGIGGSRMKSEGVDLFASVSGAIGIVETVRHWKEIISTFKKAREALVDQRPDILVLIDYPDFNLALAKKARSRGIPVLYYVSPQVWAWRRRRVKKIASLVNKMAVLFPFEVDIYKKAGLACEFVGHPIAETINITGTKEELKKNLGLDPDRRAVSLLPGSRPTEVKRHIELIKGVAEMLHNEFPDIQTIVPLAPGAEPEAALPGYIKVLTGRTGEAVACSEAAAVASGTATLETALLGTPMVVFYRLSRLTVFIARLLIKVKYISLVNLLSGKEVVKELIQDDAVPGKVFEELKKILSDDGYRYNMTCSFQEIRDELGHKRASTRVASIVGEIAGWNSINA